MIDRLDSLVERWNTSRSGTISKLPERNRREELEAVMAEGYKEWADKNRADAELYFAAQAEVVMGGRGEG